jgi:hypothetical protein
VISDSGAVMTDAIAALRAFADRLEAEARGGAQEAA